MTSYKEISNDDSDEAIQWLRVQVAMVRPKIRRKDPEKWKQSLYGPIYARARELEISKEDLYILAQDRLLLKKPISSLKELTQKNLQRLYQIIIYELNKYQSGRSD